MAVHESDREDLMREATALRRRGELFVPGEAETVIAGFRGDDRISIFFGPDPAYHFDAEGRLWRSFCGGELYRSQGSTLARLTRHREPGASSLLRHDLTGGELEDFLQAMRSRLQRVAEQLAAGQAKFLRQIPDDWHAVEELSAALDRILTSDAPLAPAVKP